MSEADWRNSENGMPSNQSALIDELRRRIAELEKALEAQHCRFEEQKVKMAEANLKMLEKTELLEEQKVKMAEANLKILEQNEIIEYERSRSEKLLLNILPIKVAQELKEKGQAEPESFDNVTVFFIGYRRVHQQGQPAGAENLDRGAK
ncbi:MAG: hypothetical protein ACFCBW_10700 [Candidatus Competibacterales bacterium]